MSLANNQFEQVNESDKSHTTMQHTHRFVPLEVLDGYHVDNAMWIELPSCARTHGKSAPRPARAESSRRGGASTPRSADEPVDRYVSSLTITNYAPRT